MVLDESSKSASGSLMGSFSISRGRFGSTFSFFGEIGSFLGEKYGLVTCCERVGLIGKAVPCRAFETA